MISFINYDHPLLAEAYDIAPQTSLDGMGYVSEFHQAITEPRMTIDSPQGYGVATESGSGRYFHHVPIGYRGKAGALPMLGQRLRTSLSLDSDLHCNRAEEILSDILVAPLDNLLELLSDSLCIGPLRTVPDSLYQPNPYPQQKDWYSGEAAWDTLESTFLTTNEDINHWIGEKAGLDLGYRLVYKIEQGQTRYLSFSGEISTLDDAYALEDAIGDELSITISEEDLAENPDAEQVPLSNDVFRKAKADIGGEIESTLYLQKKEHKYRRIALWDVRNEIEVSASEIGVGVSQLLPLVVAAHTRRKGVIACEQPELHVHPRVQVGVGDLLTQIESDASFLIETHSEHLILRILRRIRESTEGELPESLVRVDPSDISILYMEPSPDGVSVSRIEVDEDGEFVSKWPDGFFSERRKELM